MKVATQISTALFLVLGILVIILIFWLKSLESNGISRGKFFCDGVEIGTDPMRWSRLAAFQGLVHFYSRDFSVVEVHFGFGIFRNYAWCKFHAIDGKVANKEFGVVYDQD